jgi:hypothetical protein
LCPRADASGALASAESGLIYETATGRLKGEMRCP